MSIGDRIRKRRLALGIDQDQLADMVGVRPETVGRWERGRNAVTTDYLVDLARVLDLSLDELMGLRPIGRDLSGVWHAMWQTTRDGVPTIDYHTIEAKFASEYVLFQATSGDYVWRGDFRHAHDELMGTYRSLDHGRQSSGMMRFTLNAHGDTAIGTWAGSNIDGLHQYGWGVLARDKSKAELSIKYLVDRDEKLTDYPPELR